MLDPRRLLTFGEVARRGSFSRAAEALALTQPAVSQQVAALERQLGVTAARPRPRRSDADRGGRAAARARRRGRRPARPGGRARSPSSRGARPRDAARRRVPERAGLDRPRRDRAAARRAARSCEFDVVEGSAQESGAAVAAGDLHLAVCFQDASAPPHRPEGTERHVFGEEPMLADASRSTIRSPGPRTRSASRELADATWTAPSREHLIYRTCVAAGFEPHIAYVTPRPARDRGPDRRGPRGLARPAAAGGPAARRRARRGLRPRAAAHALRAHPRLRHPAGGARLHRRAQRYAGRPVSAWPSTSVWMSAVPS